MSEETTMSAAEKKKEDWMNSKWRPMMGWMYMLICTMDMVIFPVLWSLLQAVTHTPITQWNPLTLQGAGLFHIAMGAVLGIAAFGRTQEKLSGANNGGLSVAGPTPTFNAPVTNNNYTNSSNIAPPTFGTASSTYTPTLPAGTLISPSTPSKPAVVTSSSGKPMPAPQIDEPL